MPLRDIINTVSSGVVCIAFLNDRDELMGKGSGFLLSNHLITNNHVFAMGHLSHRIWIGNTFDAKDPYQSGNFFFREDFCNSLKAGSDENNCDFAILDMPPLAARGLFQFSIGDPNLFSIGDEIALLGFPLDHMHLVVHKGAISSRYRSGPADVIQIDASVNQANSGGPLIDPNSGKVIGIITRKNTGLTNIVGDLKKTIHENIRLVQDLSQTGTARIMGIDVLGALASSQEQVLQLIGQIERSANVGIGYAFSIQHVIDEGILE